MSGIIDKVKKGLHHPEVVLQLILMSPATRLLPDKLDLQLLYRACIGKKLNLEQPSTFTEKMQWLKLYDRKPLYNSMVDKYEAKNYVAAIIGEEYIIPTIGVWNSFDEINFSVFPRQFVLKCTHDSGGVIICKDKSCFCIEEAEKTIKKCLKRNLFWESREWVYKDLKPRIIAEELMTEADGTDIKDYKFFCFNGKVKCFKIDFDRFIKHGANYYDRNLELMHFGEADVPPDFERKLEIPNNINKMIELAETISRNHSFLRVDFYNINERIYFGELTFFPASGLGKFFPEEYDKILGSWIELPNANDSL